MAISDLAIELWRVRAGKACAVLFGRPSVASNYLDFRFRHKLYAPDASTNGLCSRPPGRPPIECTTPTKAAEFPQRHHDVTVARTWTFEAEQASA